VICIIIEGRGTIPAIPYIISLDHSFYLFFDKIKVLDEDHDENVAHLIIEINIIEKGRGS